MKKVIVSLAVFMALLCIVGQADAQVKFRGFTALTGGGTGALDKISVADLVTGDIGFVATEDYFYVFKYSSTATDAEDSPLKIRPDDYATAGVWSLVSLYGASLTGGPSATPSVVFLDEDATDGDDNAKIYVNCTDTGSGSEDCDMYIQVQIAGTLTTVAQIDADGNFIFSKTIALENGETIGNATDSEIKLGGTETLIIDTDTGTANEIGIKSDSDATSLNFNALNMVTTGTISGAIPSTTDNNGQTLSAAQQYGYMHWATGAGTTNLVTAVAGMSFCVYSTTAAAVVINPADGDTITLNGTALSAGDSITSASGAGDFICLMSQAANSWVTLGRSGTWTDTN